MDSLTQELLKALSEGGLSQIGDQIGVDEAAITSTLSAAAPMLLSALAKNAAHPERVDALHQALGNDHDGTILNDVAGFLGDPQAANGSGILGHVLGD